MQTLGYFLPRDGFTYLCLVFFKSSVLFVGQQHPNLRKHALIEVELTVSQELFAEKVWRMWQVSPG